jgi:AraC-like DNA-binding protein
MSALRVTKLHALLAEADRIGLHPRRALATRGLALDAFDTPTNTVDFVQARSVLEVLAEIAPADFAVRFGSRWTFHEFGLIGYGLLSRRTFGEFTDSWINHIDFIGHPLTFRSVVDDSGWSLEMRPREPLSASALRLCVEEACASVLPIFRELTGGVLTGARLEVTDDRPQHDAICRSLLNVSMKSRASLNRLVMRPRDRAAALRVDEAVLRAFCQRHCKSIMMDFAARDDLAGTIRDRLLLSCGRAPPISQLARQLGTSKRSLNRHLADLGWSYADLVDLYRHDYVMALLRTREVGAKDLAFMVGFDSPNSLRRSFRRWTGLSITEWSYRAFGTRPHRG